MSNFDSKLCNNFSSLVEEVAGAKVTQILFDDDMCTTPDPAVMRTEHVYWAKYCFGFGTYHDVFERGTNWIVAPDGVVMAIEFLFPF